MNVPYFEDLIVLVNAAGVKKVQANEMIDCVIETVRHWPYFAEKAGVSDARTAQIQANQRTYL